MNDDYRNVRSEAIKVLRALHRPDGMSRDTWLGVRAVLMELFMFLPDVFPSQKLLAERLDRHQSRISELIATALEHKL